jgi:hypothetical protein
MLSTSPETQSRATGLASLLAGINSAALSRISVSINGTASLLAQGGEEEAWCKARHKENNTFGDTIDNSDIFGGPGGEEGSGEGNGGAGWYIEGQEVRVVVVRLKDGRISDWKGMVKDWSIEDGGRGVMVNGA